MWSSVSSRLGYSRPLIAAFLVAIASILTACGGGGGGGGPSSPSAPGGGTTATKSAPLQLNYPSNLPYSDYMAAGTAGRYYKISGLDASRQYDISLSSSNSVDMLVYRDAAMSYLVCWGDCVTSASSTGELYVMVMFTGIETNGASYTLNLVPADYEGTASSPVDLTAKLPYSVTTKAGYNNYYVIHGLTPGNAYRVTTTDAYSNIYVYQDQFKNSFCCSFTSSGDTVWIRVKGGSQDETFDLDLVDKGTPTTVYSSEGSVDAPIELTFGTSFPGETDNSASYYHIGGLTAGKQYRVALRNSDQDDVGLLVYGASDYGTPVCSDTQASSLNNDHDCVATVPASGELWIKVDGSTAYQYLGASYHLEVYPYFPNEGSALEAKALTFNSGLTYNGTVDTTSYYLVSGLEQNVTYAVTITGYDRDALSFTLAKSFSYYPGCSSREINSGEQTCILSTDTDGTLAINVTESDAYQGTAFTLSVARSPYQSEGSVAAPVSLTLPVGSALSYGGQVGGDPSYYEISGLTPGQAYEFSLTGLANQQFYVYADQANIGNMQNYGCHGNTNSPSCTLRAATTSMWLMVNDDVTATAFDLSVALSAYQAEGAVDQPLALAYGSTALPHNGTVDTGESYYEITGLTAAQSYVVTVTNAETGTSSPVMYVYDDITKLGSTTWGDYTCSHSFTQTSDVYCSITPTVSSVWVMTTGNGYGSGAAYTLDADVATPSENLTLDYTAGDFPHSGTTDETQSSYTIKGLNPNQSYHVTLTNLSADLDLAVNSYSSTYPCSASTGTADEACDYTTSDGTMVITVIGNKTLHGGSFTLGLTAGPENQGTSGSPVPLDGSTGLPYTYSGEVGAGASYYVVNNLTPNTYYAVDMTNLTDNADLDLFEAIEFSTSACSSSQTGTTAERCGAFSDSNGDLYVRVDSRSSYGATFTLQVSQGPTSEGSQGGGEVTLTYPTSLPYAGHVDRTQSYYAVGGLGSKTAYTVTLTGLSDSVWLRVYSDSTYSTLACSDSGSGGTASCQATTNTGNPQTLYVEVDGSNSSAGSNYTINFAP